MTLPGWIVLTWLYLCGGRLFYDFGQAVYEKPWRYPGLILFMVFWPVVVSFFYMTKGQGDD